MTGSSSDTPAVQNTAADVGLGEVAVIAAPKAKKAAKEPPRNRNLVLVGAGLAHLQILQWWRRRPVPHVQLTLVSAFDRAAYSPLLSAAVSGETERNAFQIDLAGLCRRCGVQLVVDRAVRLDPGSKQIELAHQPTLTFDVASINMGSVPSAEVLCQTHRMLVCVKPLVTFPDRFEIRLQELLQQHREAQRRDLIPIAVVGGGASGVELALCFEERVHQQELPVDVMLVEGGGEILPGHSLSLIQRTRRLLKKRGIDVYTGRRVAGCEEDGAAALILDDGAAMPCELAIWATGAAPPAVLNGFDLPKSDRGFLQVWTTLQCTGEAPVFAAGDVADLFGEPVRKSAGVALRQAKLLWRNLQQALADQPLADLRPSNPPVSLINCGDGTALLECGGWSFHGAWCGWWKRRSDRRFFRRFGS